MHPALIRPGASVPVQRQTHPRQRLTGDDGLRYRNPLLPAPRQKGLMVRGYAIAVTPMPDTHD